MRVVRFWWIAATMLAALLMGCGDDQVETAVTARPMILDYNFQSDPTVLDPAYAVDDASLTIVAQLFEGLTSLDPQSSEARPALSEAWDVSGDGLTYTFKIRENAIWMKQDGGAQRQVIADDVVFAIKRACHPGSTPPARAILFVIKGCREVSESEGIPDLDRIGVRALDQFVVEFTLAYPAAYFPLIMSLPIAYPLPRELVENNASGWTEIDAIYSNGPYLITDWRRGEQLTLTRNPHYYDLTAAAINQVNGHFINDPNIAMQMYLEYRLDTIEIPPSASLQIRQSEELAGEHAQAPQSCTYSYAFTMIKPPVDNARVRRALSLAIDRQWLAESGPVVGQMVARHFAAPMTFGVPPAHADGITSDVAAAQTTLAQAGYPGGQGFPAISMLVPSGAHHMEVATAVAEMWTRQLGIEVVVHEQPSESYRTAIASTRPLSEMPHVWLLGWCAEYPDEHQWLYEVFNLDMGPFQQDQAHSRWQERVTIDAGSNPMRRTPGALDQLMTEAAGERDNRQRQELYAEAEQRVTVEEAIVAPLYHHTWHFLTRPWVERHYRAAWGQSFKGWTVDMAAKEQAQSAPTPERMP